MGLVIKKRVSLDFLGEEYADSYLLIQSASVREYEDLKNTKTTVKEEVIQRFVDGEINQNGEMVKITKENIEDLPGEVFVKAFDAIIGKIDPKQ